MNNKDLELYQAYNKVFNSEEGKLVLEDIKKTFSNAKNEKDPNELFRKTWYNNGKQSVLNIIKEKKDYLNK